MTWDCIVKAAKRENESIQDRKRKRMIIALTAAALFLAVSATLANRAFAGGFIAMANYYPEDGGTYESVDHFLTQATAINTNTTVTVSIDGELPIPMAYEGTRNEIVPGDSATRDWHTWLAAVPAVTTPGNHTFQFFSHYYVWQDADQYWAEFNAQSNVKSFTIPNPQPPSSQSPQPTITNQVYILAAVAISSAALLLLVALFLPRKSWNSKLHASP
jgi:hypothetical protein